MKRFFCWFAFFASIQQSLHAQSRLQDSLVLVDFYHATNGANWTDRTNWLTTNPIEQWFGITTNQGRVEKIEFVANQLTGTLPASLGNLSQLTRLYLYSNQITGTIPTSLGNLTKLTELMLAQNQFTGRIPTTLGNLTHLNRLHLEFNQLTGTIPATLGNLTALTHLYLDNNQLTGIIPSTLGNLTTLETLSLQINQLTGSIPASLGRLSNLRLLILQQNQLTGNIPDSLGGMSNIRWLWLHGNQLTGNIPHTLGRCQYLSDLNLTVNQLTGTIPDSLGRLSNLVRLNLGSNQLKGRIPDSLGNARKLAWLSIDRNQLTGKVPTSFQNLRLLTWFDCSYNKIDSMPDLSMLPINGYNWAFNRLTFDDILPTLANPAPFSYCCQDSIYRDTAFFKNSSDSLWINLGIDAALTTNKYEWYKNGMLFQTNIGNNQLIFNNLQPIDNGTYTCKITNSHPSPSTQGFALYSRKIKINVDCRFTQVAQQRQICENSSYRLSNGRQVSSVGIHRDTINCDTILLIQLTLLRRDTTLHSETTCNPSAAGIRDTVLKNRFGCDSLVRTTVTFVPVQTFLAARTCNPSAAGIRDTVLKNRLGCDSLVRTTFTYVPIVTRLRDSIVCLAKDTQTITRKELSFQGCDSTVIRILRLQRDTILTNTFICDTVNQRIETTLVSNRDGCQSMVQTQYRFEPCECLKTTTIYNALISNDNDQKNDVFFIQNIENFQPNELIITDKRNEFIYRVSNYNNDWKGTNLQGISLPAGTYNYVFRMTQSSCLRVGVVDLKYD
jgi:Leucine-rich repeat (LRR) protein